MVVVVVVWRVVARVRAESHVVEPGSASVASVAFAGVAFVANPVLAWRSCVGIVGGVCFVACAAVEIEERCAVALMNAAAVADFAFFV